MKVYRVRETNKSKKGFYSYPQRSLEDQLLPSPTLRVLSKDIERKQNLPAKITNGARFTDTVAVNFFANASAGNFSTEIPLDLETVPIVMVWHLGNYDKNGNTSTGTGIINAGLTGTVLNGTYIFSGAQAVYTVNKDSLTISITSTNVGYSVFLDAYFKYAVYYDETNVNHLGL